MDTALIRSLMAAFPDIDDLGKRKMEGFTTTFEKFFQWERERILLGDPTEQEKQDHGEFLCFTIRLVKLLLALDPNERLQLLKTRLDDSWLIFHNPLSDDQANKVLAEVFPE